MKAGQTPVGILPLILVAGTAIIAFLIPPEINARGAVYLAFVLGGLTLILGLSIWLRQPPVVWAVITIAFCARITLMVLLKIHSYNSGLNGFYPSDGGDAYFYHDWSVATALNDNWFAALSGRPNYVYVVTTLYRVFGPDITMPQLLNLLLSVLAVPLIFELGRRVNLQRAGLAGILLWSVLPSGVLWSISLLKDIWIVVGILLVMFFVTGVTNRSPRMIDYVFGLTGLLVIAFMRMPYLAVPILTLGILMLKGERLGGLGHKVLFLGAGFAGVVALIVSGIIIPEWLVIEVTRAFSDEGVEFLTSLALSEESGIPLIASVPAAFRWIVQLPYAIFAPFPWQWAGMGSGLGRLAGAEMCIIYYVYFLVWRQRRPLQVRGKGILIATAMIFFAVSLALPNIGSIYRYRWPAVALLLCLLPAMPQRVPQTVSRKDQTTRGQGLISSQA